MNLSRKISQSVSSFLRNTKDFALGAEVQNFDEMLIEQKGHGFVHKNIEYIHHSTLPLNETTFRRFSNPQKVILFTLFIVFIFSLIYGFSTTLLIAAVSLSLLYVFDIFFNLFVIGRGIIKRPEYSFSDKQISKLKNKDLPLYSILCPLYKEKEVLPQFIKNINAIDYPKRKLQVLIILEENDKETFEAARSLKLPKHFEILIMPDSLPKTKPKALNYAMKFVKGEYSVVYDAEDAPDIWQLKKVILAFKKANKKTVCVQAKLNFYNPDQNILTRLFTGEYALLYELILPGLQSFNAPIPLGGTSNHFKTSKLNKLNYWDSFNVTEDCDLGVRLFKKGYLTAIVDSTTYEEANSQVKNWISQRTRWIKGYILSYFVHLRNPKEFVENTPFIHLITYNFIIGGKIFMLLVNPIMWMIIIIFVLTNLLFGLSFTIIPRELLPISIFTLIFGHLFYVIYFAAALNRIGKKEFIKYVIFVPFYWFLMSVASYNAIYEIARRPHAWSKTIHGLHLNYLVNKEVTA